MGARRERFRAFAPALVFGEQLVKVMHHRRARARRADDGVAAGLFKDRNETLGQGARFASISGVESGLAAARLPLVEDDFATGTPEHFDRARADGRPQLIYQTGDE